MKRKRAYLILLGLIAVLVGIAIFFVAPSADYGQVILALNMEKWRAQNIGHYRFTVQFECMCAEGTSTIEVRNNQAIAIIAGYDAGAPLQDNPVLPTGTTGLGDTYLTTLRSYSTIDKIFVEAYASLPDIHGEYDPTLGYPTSMCMGGCLRIGDDPISTDPLIIHITDFEKLP